MIVVLDASVAIKWFVAEDEPTQAAAVALLDDVVAGRITAAVPELFFYEVLAVLLRRGRTADEAGRAVHLVTALGLRRFPLDEELAAESARLAEEHRLTGYDAAYAALAESLGGRWATFDEEAHRRVASLGLSYVPEQPEGSPPPAP